MRVCGQALACGFFDASGEPTSGKGNTGFEVGRKNQNRVNDTKGEFSSPVWTVIVGTRNANCNLRLFPFRLAVNSQGNDGFSANEGFANSGFEGGNSGFEGNNGFEGNSGFLSNENATNGNGAGLPGDNGGSTSNSGFEVIAWGEGQYFSL